MKPFFFKPAILLFAALGLQTAWAGQPGSTPYGDVHPGERVIVYSRGSTYPHQEVKLLRISDQGDLLIEAANGRSFYASAEDVSPIIRCGSGSCINNTGIDLDNGKSVQVLKVYHDGILLVKPKGSASYELPAVSFRNSGHDEAPESGFVASLIDKFRHLYKSPQRREAISEAEAKASEAPAYSSSSHSNGGASSSRAGY